MRMETGYIIFTTCGFKRLNSEFGLYSMCCKQKTPSAFMIRPLLFNRLATL